MLWRNGYSVLAGLLSCVLNWDCYPMIFLGCYPELLSEVTTSVILIIILIIMMTNNIAMYFHLIKGWDASLIFSNRLF